MTNRQAEEIFGRLERIEKALKLRPKQKRKRKLTWKEKGWWSPTEVFGPRAYDC